MIPFVIRGSGFRGALNYVMKKREMPDGSIFVPITIAGNMSGSTARELSSEFGVARKLRPDVQRPVWHCPISLPPFEHVSDEKFAEIAAVFMKKMGFSELHPWVFVLHKEKEHLHGHIIASRISIDSKLWLGKNEAKTAIQACRDIEKEFGLKRVLSHQAEKRKIQENEYHHHTPEQVAPTPRGTSTNCMRKLSECRLASAGKGQRAGVLQIDARASRRDSERMRRKPSDGSVMNKNHIMSEPVSQASINASRRADRQGTRKNNLSQIRAIVFECIQAARNENQFQEQISRRGLEAEYRTRGDGQIYGWKLRESGADEWLSATSISRSFSWPQIMSSLEVQYQTNVPPAQAVDNTTDEVREEIDKKSAAIKKTIQALNDAQLRELHEQAQKIKNRPEAPEFVPVVKGMPGLLQKLLNLVVRVLTLGKYGLPQVQNQVQNSAPTRADDSVENINYQACSVLIQKIEEEQKMRARMSMLKKSAHASSTKSTPAIPHQNQDFEPDADERDNEYQRERGG